VASAASRLILGRIDAACEQRFEIGIDADAAKPAFDQRVEAECRQVAFVEDDGMPQVDRTAVVRRVIQQIEERLCSRAVSRVPIRNGFHRRRAARVIAEAGRSSGHKRSLSCELAMLAQPKKRN